MPLTTSRRYCRWYPPQLWAPSHERYRSLLKLFQSCVPLLDVKMTQEKSSEALLEAWSASVMTMEHMEVAVEDQHFLEHLLENVALGSVEPSNEHCGNLTMLAQEVYLGRGKKPPNGRFYLFWEACVQLFFLRSQTWGYSNDTNFKYPIFSRFAVLIGLTSTRNGDRIKFKSFHITSNLAILLHHQSNQMWKQHEKQHRQRCLSFCFVDPPNLNSAAVYTFPFGA